MNKEIEKWEEQEGVKFLRRIGLYANQAVLDFGCRVGHYTIPAAKIVGSNGIVYAIDTQQHALKELRQKAKTHNLTNIRIIKTAGRMKLPLESEEVDVILLYDVLHCLRKDKRTKLYHEAFRLLKQNGLLSVYPKHTAEDDPTMEFQHLHVSDIRQEIQNSGFSFDRKYFATICHITAGTNQTPLESSERLTGK